MPYICRWTFVNHCCSSLCKQWTNHLETGYRSAVSSPFCAIASYSGKIVRQYPSSFQTINGQLTLCRGLDRRIRNHLTLYCSRATDKDCTISNQSFWSRKCYSNFKQPGSIARYNFCYFLFCSVFFFLTVQINFCLYILAWRCKPVTAVTAAWWNRSGKKRVYTGPFRRSHNGSLQCEQSFRTRDATGGVKQWTSRWTNRKTRSHYLLLYICILLQQCLAWSRVTTAAYSQLI